MTISCDSCGQENLQSADYFHHCSMCRFDLCFSCAPQDQENDPLAVEDNSSVIFLDTDFNSTVETRSSGFQIEGPPRNKLLSLHFPRLEFLRGNSSNIESLFADYIHAGSIMYARECVKTMLTVWPVDATLSQDSFGSVSHFLTFLKAVYIEESKRQFTGTQMLKIMLKSVQDILRNKRRQAAEFCDSLIGFSTHQIFDTLKFLTSFKKTKVVVKTYESAHPYSTNVDENIEIHFSGVKYIKVVFDPRSATKESVDFIQVYKDETHSSLWHDWKYTGKQGSVCWSKPCKVLADKCYFHFHSDSSNGDWGYKITCYGIIEEPELDEMDDQRHMLASFVTQANLAFRILEIVCGETNENMLSKLFIPRTIRALRRYAEVIFWDKKLEVLRLIGNMSHQIHKVNISETATQELYVLLRSLTSLMKSKYSLDGIAASGKPSVILQALIEAVFILDGALSNKIMKSGKFMAWSGLPEGIIALRSPESG
jgi:hypothetical protein